MNYKLISDGAVVDVVKNPCHVVYVSRLGLFLACPEAQAQGVASRTGATYWHIDGKPEFGVDGYMTVAAVAIDDAEADELIQALESGETPTIPDPETPPNTLEQVLSAEEMRKRILDLTSSVAALKQENSMLMECLLEMSEAVYA